MDPTFGLSQFGAVSETEAPESAAIAMTKTVAAPKAMSVALAVPAAAPAQKSFAFGHLEFDWDPNAPGGVPGFDSWPSAGRRVTDESSGN